MPYHYLCTDLVDLWVEGQLGLLLVLQLLASLLPLLLQLLIL